MMIRLYREEDSMRRSLVRALRARGVDVITALEAGIIGRTDEQQLECATTQGRVLYSFNVAHLYRLHTAYVTQGRSHAGIVLARQQRYSVAEQMRRLLKLTASMSAEEMKNRVEFLSAWD
jgi:hypothetical protein